MTTLSPSMSFAEWGEHWLEHHVAPSVRPATLHNYSVAIQQWAIPFMGEIVLDDLRPSHVRQWIVYMHETRGLAATTTGLYRAALSVCLKAAVAERLVPSNPARGIRGPKPRVKRRALDPEHIPALIETSLSRNYYGLRYWYGPLIVTGVTTGMRVGELAALKWDRVDLETGMVTIDLQYSERYGWSEPKSSAGFRELQLPAITLSVVRAQREIVARERMRVGTKRWRHDDLVFPNSKGRPALNAEVNRSLTRICKEADIPRITAHGMRHTYAGAEIAGGMNGGQLKQLLGHKKISTTLDIYGSQLSKRVASEAASEMDRLIQDSGLDIGG